MANSVSQASSNEAEKSNRIQLEIVTPVGKALGLIVDEVRAPSVDGEFGVLPGHLPLLATLRTGLVIYRQGAEEVTVAIGGGFAEVGPNKVIILTDSYMERSGVDPVLIRRDLAQTEEQLGKLIAVANQDLQDTAASEERRVLILKENWLAAQLELYGDPPPPTMRPWEEYGPPSPTTDGPEETLEHASEGT